MMHLAIVIIVRLNLSATPFDSWEYGGVGSLTIPSSAKNLLSSLLIYSPPPSNLNLWTLTLNCHFTIARKFFIAIAASDLCLRKYIQVNLVRSSMKVM